MTGPKNEINWKIMSQEPVVIAQKMIKSGNYMVAEEIGVKRCLQYIIYLSQVTFKNLLKLWSSLLPYTLDGSQTS